MEQGRKIKEIFIETDSESESSTSSNGRETTEPTPHSGGPPVQQAAPSTEEKEDLPLPTLVSPLDDTDLDSAFYQREDELVSPTEPDINFQEAADDPLDITHISESIAVSDDIIPITSPAAIPPVESSKVTEDPPQTESPPPQPKLIDPNKEYCFCRQPPDDHSMIYCHQCLEWFHGECVGLTRQKATCIRKFYCPLCIDKNPSLVSVFESKAEVTRASEQLAKGGGQEKKSKHKKHSRRCGECVACLTEIDCRQCRFCRDMTKYGGRGSLRQKCIKRQCHRYSRILYTEDPVFSKQPGSIQEDIAAELSAVGGDVSQVEGAVGDKGGQKFKRPPVELSVDNGHEEGMEPPAAKKKVGVTKKGKPGKGGGVKGGAKGKSQKRSMKPKTKTRLSTSDFDLDEIDRTVSTRRSRQPFADILGGGYYRDDPPQQCQGPECVYSARPHSKYCSEECGVQLAIRRIRKHLPDKKQLHSEEEAQATHRNTENLERLEGEQKTIKGRLEELDRQTVAIDDHVGRLSSVTPINDDETEVDSDDLTINCATCSQPVTLKKAMTHFERCFNRLEGMVSFGSIVKNEGTNIFCDKYDSSQKTYCKRLRVLCPEHTKEPKIHPKEVCGCPLEAKFPSQLLRSKKYCRLPKKSCVRHYCWEKLRKAEIDQEKLNLFLKLEELNEQSRLNQWQIDARGSLLAIMLHHTIDHDREPSHSTLSSSHDNEQLSMEVDS